MANNSQAPSFKTDVNRAKTKKWITAQNYSYDGDEWGGYGDDQDEDGNDDDNEDVAPPPPPPASAKPTGLRQRGQASAPSQRESTKSHNSSSAPQAVTAAPLQQHRAAPAASPPQHDPVPQRNESFLRERASFEYGDEIRDFSVGSLSSASVAVRGSSTTAVRPERISSVQHPAFTPRKPETDAKVTASPPPRMDSQQTRAQPEQRSTSRDHRPGNTAHPPRESSLSKGPSTANQENTAAGIAPGPLIRPADIYRRMQEEKQRQSLDANNDGPDISSTSESARLQGEDSTSGPEQYGMDGFPIRAEASNAFLNSEIPLLPKFDRFSGFGSDFWGSSALNDDKLSNKSDKIAEPDQSATKSSLPAPAHASVSKEVAPSSTSMSATGGNVDDGNAGLSSPAVDTHKLTVSKDLDEGETSAVPQGDLVSSRTKLSVAGPSDDNDITANLAHAQSAGPGTSNDPSTKEQNSQPAGPSSSAKMETNAIRVSLDADHGVELPVHELDLASLTRQDKTAESEQARGAEREERASFTRAHATDSTPDQVNVSKSDFDSKTLQTSLQQRQTGQSTPAEALHISRKPSSESISSWASSKRSSSPTKTHHPADPRDLPPASSLQAEHSDLPGAWISEPTAAAGNNVSPEASEVRQRSCATESPQDPASFSQDKIVTSHLKTHDNAQMMALASAGAALGGASLSQVTKEDVTAVTGELHSDASLARHNSAVPAPLKSTAVLHVETPKPLLSVQGGQSDGEYESDRLHNDIVRSLTPRALEPGTQPSAAASGTIPSPSASDTLRESSLFPREYDSYWGDQGAGSLPSSRKPSEAGEYEQRRENLRHRFSWEDDGESLQVSADLPDETLRPAHSEGKDELQPRIQNKVANDEAKDDPNDVDATPEPDHRVEEARLSEQNSSVQVTEQPFAPPGDQSPTMKEQTAVGSRPPSDNIWSGADAHASARVLNNVPVNGASKPPSFKQIVGIKAFGIRMDKYAEAQQQYAALNTGLDDWLAQMIADHPELANATSSGISRVSATAGLGGTMKTRISPGLSKLARGVGATSTPYYQQYLDSAATINTSSSQASAGAADSVPDPGFKGRTASQSRKDFFTTAGLIGGKATTSAKGLFSKGRNRFRASTDRAD